MKRMKIAGILLSCLLIASHAAAFSAFAGEETAVQTKAETTETPGTVTSDNAGLPDVAGAVMDIVRVTRSLSEEPGDTQNGFVHDEDGNVSYFVDGKKLTGHFSITTEYLKGDLEGNGTVDAGDASVVLVAATKAAVLNVLPEDVLAEEMEQFSTSFQAEQVADINDDGSIDASDAAALLIYAARIGSGEQLSPLGCGQYYADKDGILQQGWIDTGDQVFYAGEDYALHEGWLDLDGNTYFFSEDAELQKGFVEYRDHTYYMGTNGAMVTGWLDMGDALCYFDLASGAQAFGMTLINESYYYFGADGALRTGGFFKEKDGTRYADENGVIALSFTTIGDERYYFFEDGTMAAGLTEIDGSTYLFTKDGMQQFGWQESKEGLRYFNETTGKMAFGFTKLEDGTRYFDNDGLMLTGWQEIKKKTYYFDADGIMQTGMVTIDDETYRFNSDGVYAPVKICLDAGHYAKYNKSPVNSAYWESDFTWKMHLYLKEALEGYGIEVITTRENQDTDLGLSARGYASEGCDLFLSLHSNACGVESVDAPLACCTVTGTCDELGQMLADKVAEVMETNQPGKIWKRVGQDGDWYSVLWGATKVGTPAILLEHSYHTNKRATAWLLVDANVKRMAEAEAELLARYFGVIE